MIDFSRLLVVIVLIFLSAHTCSKKDKALSSTVFNHWKHSYEEDQDGLKIYRLSTFQFPPSRGREGFEIRKNGEFIKHGIAASDEPIKTLGSWSQISDNKIVLSYADPGLNDTIEIASTEKDLLKIKN
jgi:hypothetical protein